MKEALHDCQPRQDHDGSTFHHQFCANLCSSDLLNSKVFLKEEEDCSTLMFSHDKATVPLNSSKTGLKIRTKPPEDPIL